jgi:hypothetical protein
VPTIAVDPLIVLVDVRCRWCGKVWGRLPARTPYERVTCPQRNCGMSLDGVAMC